MWSAGLELRRSVFCTLLVLIAVVCKQAVSADTRPNILYIMTDQQHAGMMSCAGNRWLKTPALDRLAARGVRFERAYCTNPVCRPSRLSMVTGHMPSRFGMFSNKEPAQRVSQAAMRQCIGWIFRNAGYETAFGGKTHWPKGMTPEALGFTDLTRDERDQLAEACVRFLEARRDKPFLLVASFINPHDICYMAIDDFVRATQAPPMYPQSVVERQQLALAMRLPPGVPREEFFRHHAPPLPDNFEVPEQEPECVTTAYLGPAPFRAYARREWSAEQWRLHRWAYCRLTEMVDAQIGRVLAALQQQGLEERTVVVFSSDHGDLDSAHRLEHKSVLYEEAARVPFIVSYRGVTPAGLVDRRHLVSAGLDLLPTLCDFAGVPPPPDLPGRSVRTLAEGHSPDAWREDLVVESSDGRAIRTDRFKYTVYRSGKHREQLIDLQADPGEMKNLAENPAYRGVLQEHRRRLAAWVRRVRDEDAKAYLVEPQ